jgi:hypothetical protein
MQEARSFDDDAPWIALPLEGGGDASAVWAGITGGAAKLDGRSKPLDAAVGVSGGGMPEE